MSKLLDLSGKVALITGAGQGIGRQIGVFMAEHGAKAVIINDIVAERADKVAAEITKIGSQGVAAPADITVTANCVALGATNTPAVSMMVDAAKADPNIAKKVFSRYVIKRFGEPSDPAAMVLFLASEAAGWITGQTFPVNGGYSMTM